MDAKSLITSPLSEMEAELKTLPHKRRIALLESAMRKCPHVKGKERYKELEKLWDAALRKAPVEELTPRQKVMKKIRERWAAERKIARAQKQTGRTESVVFIDEERPS